MSLITEPNGLIEQPHDPFWDGPATRRELQRFADIFSQNDELLTMRADTGHIVINLICEKLGITKAELESYVTRKRAEMKAGTQSNGPNK